MTEITVHRNAQQDLCGFTVHGHSKSAPKGEDIVCASISTLFEVLLSAARGLPQEAIKYTSNPEKALRSLKVDPEKLQKQKREVFSGVLNAVLEVAEKLADRHPSYCSIREESP
jgi:hypothetical protein